MFIFFEIFVSTLCHGVVKNSKKVSGYLNDKYRVKQVVVFWFTIFATGKKIEFVYVNKNCLYKSFDWTEEATGNFFETKLRVELLSYILKNLWTTVDFLCILNILLKNFLNELLRFALVTFYFNRNKAIFLNKFAGS